MNRLVFGWIALALCATISWASDTCPATVIASVPFNDSGTTISNANDFNFCGGLFSSDVIYQYTPPATANYTLLFTSTYLGILALNTGGACPGNTQVYCHLNPGNTQGVIDVQLTASSTYYIIIDGQDGLAGSYTLNVSQACDTCEADSCPATLIPSLPYTDNGTTEGRENNFSTYYCGGQNAPDVIYRLTVPTTQNIVARLTNEPLPHLRELALRSGSVCPGENVECNFGGNYGIGASLSFQALANVTYYLVVDDNSTRSGPYTLTVAPVCEVTAQPGDIIECGPETPGIPHQSNDCSGGCENLLWGGTANFIPYSCGQTIFGQMFTYRGTQAFSDTDWFRFTLTQPCSLAVTVTAEFPWDLIIKQALCEPTYAHFYSGSACSTITEIEHSSPMHVLPAGVYDGRMKSQQDTAMSDPLHYRLRVDCFPVCGEDGAITSLPGSYSSNTCGEGDDCTLDIQQQVDTEDRLVRVDIPEQGRYTFSLCSSAEPWTSYMTVMSSCCDNPFIIAQSDGGCVNGLAELECISLEPGPVFVLVENDGNEGPPFCTENFTLTVTPCPCPVPDSVTVRWNAATSAAEIRFISTVGSYQIYSTDIPNNDGDPRGGDPQWTLRLTQGFPGGIVVWTDTNVTSEYRNYVVLKTCP